MGKGGSTVSRSHADHVPAPQSRRWYTTVSGTSQPAQARHFTVPLPDCQKRRAKFPRSRKRKASNKRPAGPPTLCWDTDCLESPPAMPVERVASVRCSLWLSSASSLSAEPVLGKKTLHTRALQLTQKSAAAAPIARGRGDLKGQLCFDLCFYSKCL